MQCHILRYYILPDNSRVSSYVQNTPDTFNLAAAVSFPEVSKEEVGLRSTLYLLLYNDPEGYEVFSLGASTAEISPV